MGYYDRDSNIISTQYTEYRTARKRINKKETLFKIERNIIAIKKTEDKDLNFVFEFERIDVGWKA